MKMHKLKKISVAFILIAALAFSVIIANAEDSYLVLYGFAFDINSSGEAVIHEYDNRTLDVAVPDTLLDAPVAEISDYAFFGDSEITSISFDSATQLRTIGFAAFYGCSSLSAINIPDSIQSLGFGAFQECSSASEITIGSGLTQLPGQAFYGCYGVAEITVPDTIDSIDEYAFGNCSGLTKIIIPRSVTSIAQNAFKGSDNVTIYCYRRSYAAEYAQTNSIPFVYIDQYELGDVNMDGEVNINDATDIQKYIANIITFTDEQTELADYLEDGFVNISDVTEIQRFIAGIR